MYLQITTRCNMTCEHCAFSCTHEGEDMTMETFRNALAYGDDSNVLGGGEPTLHPRFWEMFGLCLGAGDLWMATNGSIPEITLPLIKMAQKGVIGLAVSDDMYHDGPDSEVSSEIAYLYRESYKSDGDLSIRQIGAPVAVGRAQDLEEAVAGCACEGTVVRVNGDVTACGCPDAPVLGNVNNKDDDTWWTDITGECHKVEAECVA